MSEFADLLRAVAHAVEDGGDAGGVLKNGDELEAYRRNRRQSRFEVLRENFPVTATLMGERNFKGLASAFDQSIGWGPSTLRAYGLELPRHIENDEALSALMPGLAAFAWVDLAMHHPARPPGLRLELPANILDHYAAVVERGELADAPLSALKSFSFE